MKLSAKISKVSLKNICKMIKRKLKNGRTKVSKKIDTSIKNSPEMVVKSLELFVCGAFEIENHEDTILDFVEHYDKIQNLSFSTLLDHIENI